MIANVLVLTVARLLVAIAVPATVEQQADNLRNKSSSLASSRL